MAVCVCVISPESPFVRAVEVERSLLNGDNLKRAPAEEASRFRTKSAKVLKDYQVIKK